MISLQELVWFVFYAIIAAGVIALLWFALTYAETTFGGPPMLWKVIKFIFVILIIFLLINLLLGLLGGTPMIRWR